MKWWVAYRWFRTLAKDGTWQRIHDGLHARVREEEGRAAEPTACALDSQSAQSAEGGESISFDKSRHCRGRKRHLAADTLGFLCARKVTGARASDRTAGRDVWPRRPAGTLTWPWPGRTAGTPTPSTTRSSPGRGRTPGIEVVVVKRTDNVKGFRILPRRWVIERTNAWISAHRRLAREYERLVECSEAMIDLAMIDVMAARLAGGRPWRHWRDTEPAPSVI